MTQGTRIALVLLASAAGCTSSGERMDAQKVGEIRKGVTTRAEVDAKLGPPDQVLMLPEGRRELVYSHYETQTKATSFIPVVNMFATGADTRRQQLQVIVGRNDVVEDYEFTDRTGETTLGPFGHTSESPTAQPANR